MTHHVLGASTRPGPLVDADVHLQCPGGDLVKVPCFYLWIVWGYPNSKVHKPCTRNPSHITYVKRSSTNTNFHAKIKRRSTILNHFSQISLECCVHPLSFFLKKWPTLLLQSRLLSRSLIHLQQQVVFHPVGRLQTNERQTGSSLKNRVERNFPSMILAPKLVSSSSKKNVNQYQNGCHALFVWGRKRKLARST